MPLPRKAKKLLFTDGETMPYALTYARHALQSPIDAVVRMSSWDDLTRLLRYFEEIEELVIDAHGASGQMNIGEQGESLDSVVPKRFPAGTKVAKVGRLNLAGCTIAEGLDKAVVFAKRLSAKSLVASTWFRVTAPVTRSFEGRPTEDTLSAKLGDLARFLITDAMLKRVAVKDTVCFTRFYDRRDKAIVPSGQSDVTVWPAGRSIASIATALGMTTLGAIKGGNVTVALEWFRGDAQGIMPSDTALGRKRNIPRGEMPMKTIKEAEVGAALARYRAERMPPELVTVTF